MLDFIGKLPKCKSLRGNPVEIMVFTLRSSAIGLILCYIIINALLPNYRLRRLNLFTWYKGGHFIASSGRFRTFGHSLESPLLFHRGLHAQRSKLLRMSLGSIYLCAWKAFELTALCNRSAGPAMARSPRITCLPLLTHSVNSFQVFSVSVTFKTIIWNLSM